MAYLINDHCIACDLCAAVCPNHAIAPAVPVYRINPYYCTECLGFAGEPQCTAVCPAGAIVPASALHSQPGAAPAAGLQELEVIRFAA